MPYIPIDLRDHLDVDDLATPVKGRLLVGDGTQWTVIEPGSESEVLTVTSASDDIGWAVPATGNAATGGGGAVYEEVIGDTTTTAFTINHNLGSEAVAVAVYDTSVADSLQVEATVELVDADNVRVTFSTAPGTDEAKVVVVGGVSSGGGATDPSRADVEKVGGATNAITSGTYTPATYNTEHEDVGGLADLGANADRITFAEAGTYLITFALSISVSITSDVAGRAALYNSGGTLIDSFATRATRTGGVPLSVHGSCWFTVAAGDYVRAEAITFNVSSSIAASSSMASTRLQAVKIG